MNLVERRDATEATKQWFASRPFDWRRSSTCVHMVRRHLAAMGHRVPPVPRFRSEPGAIAALKAKGWKDLEQMLDSFLPRIAPAEAIVGDVVQLPSEGALGALCVVVGNGRVMGYAEGHDALTVAQPMAFAGAWRA